MSVAFHSRSPEWRFLEEHVTNDNESDDGKCDANNSSHDYIKGVMKVITDPCQADPERKDDHSKLEEGSDDLDWSCKPPEAGVVDPGEVIETGLEIDDEEHAAVETETGMTRQEGQPCLV